SAAADALNLEVLLHTVFFTGLKDSPLALLEEARLFFRKEVSGLPADHLAGFGIEQCGKSPVDQHEPESGILDEDWRGQAVEDRLRELRAFERRADFHLALASRLGVAGIDWLQRRFRLPECRDVRADYDGAAVIRGLLALQDGTAVAERHKSPATAPGAPLGKKPVAPR